MKLGSERLPSLALALVLAAGPLLNAASRTSTAHRTRTPQVQSSASHHRRHSSSKRATTAHKLKRPNAYQRLAKMQMDPSRVESIQKALSGAGAYHGTPTGRWDSDTRDAMARYQSQNGFGVTGLPDAKSLMKMGLGPHPLPAELDKTRAANLDPNAGGASPARTDSAPSGETPPPTSAVAGPAPHDPPER